jgi:hypothetical protein
MYLTKHTAAETAHKKGKRATKHFQRRCIRAEPSKMGKVETKGGAVCAIGGGALCVWRNIEKVPRALKMSERSAPQTPKIPQKIADCGRVDEPMGERNGGGRTPLAMSPSTIRQCLSGLSHTRDPTQSHHSVHLKY